MSNEPENTRPQGSARLPNGRFAPGVSPNPGGRPKGLAELQELARSHSATAIARLAYIAEHGKSEQAQIAACIALLDRGYGKPTQPMAGDNTAPPIQYSIDVPAKETREEWLARQEKERQERKSVH